MGYSNILHEGDNMSFLQCRYNTVTQKLKILLRSGYTGFLAGYRIRLFKKEKPQSKRHSKSTTNSLMSRMQWLVFVLTRV